MNSVNVNPMRRLLVFVRFVLKSWLGRSTTADNWSVGWTAPPGWTRPPIPNRVPPALSELTRVVPIAQTQMHADLPVTLISLECYPEGSLLHGQYAYKYGPLGPEHMFMTFPIVTAQDDRGNHYDWWPNGGNDNRFRSVLAPALDPEARWLQIEIPEVRWQFLREKRRLTDPGPWVFRVVLG